MPTATFMCIDSSDFMRNGDYNPNRIMAVQEACNILSEAMMQRNPENVLGFLTFGGKACSVRETLTEDIDRVTGSLSSIAVSGDSNFAQGIQIGMLALSHVRNTRSEKQLVVFVGSPIKDEPAKLQQLAKRLRKDEVAITTISLGVTQNTEMLQQFTDSVGKNAFLYVVPEGRSVVDFLFATTLMGGDGNVTSASAAGGGGNANNFGGQQVEDPELAMALRASLEEEQQRQGKQALGGDAAPTTSSSTTTGTASNQNQNQASSGGNTEEDDLELALRLSMEGALKEEEEKQKQQQKEEEGKSSQDESSKSSKKEGDNMSEFEAALNDPSLQDALKKITEDGDSKSEGEGEKKEKK